MESLAIARRPLPEFVAAIDNVVANGRGIARLMSVIACRGELAGRHYLSPGLVAEAGRGETYDECPLMGWIRVGLGLGLDSDAFHYPTPTTMGWGGFGGSWGLADPPSGLSLGFAPNNWDTNVFREDPRHARLAHAFATVAEGLGESR